jgi:hypothetical protein
MKTTIFLFIFLMVSSLSVLAQAPPTPPSNASNGGANGPVGGNAPVGSGLTIMLVLGAVWAGKKAYHNTRNEESV